MADGLKGSKLAVQLGELLQQHRGIVESAPAELNRERLIDARRKLQMVNSQLFAAREQLAGVEGLSVSALGEQLSHELPQLIAAADKVISLAYNFVQDQAMEASRGPYASAADCIQHELSVWRNQRSEILNHQIALLSASANSLITKVVLCGALVSLLGIAAIFMVRGLLLQLGCVRTAMLRLAKHDVTPILLLARNDEIGAVARAVESFRQNAIMVATQKAELKQAALRFETAIGNMSQGLCFYDADDCLQVVNERFSKIFGIAHTRLRQNLRFRDVIQISIEAGNHPGKTVDEVIAVGRTGPDELGSRIVLVTLGSGKVVSISRRLMQGGGWVATYEDVTDRRAAEEKIIFMARHDALTSLPNRVMLHERLQQVVANAGRGRQSALLCLDLDNFKVVNDTFGHPVGDGLLKAVAARLSATLREEDMAARLGGDEFAVLQDDIARPEDAKRLAERIIASLTDPYEIDGHHIVIGTSIGIALAPTDGGYPAKLLKNADMALYRVKAEGRGDFRFFEPEMDARLQSKRQLEADLRSALAQGEFELFFQPLINLSQGVVTGFEALLRWRHPTRGLVPPAEFISVIEDIGLIIPIGEWVLSRACAEAASWPEHVKVAVNLSPVQFKSPQLADAVRRALATSGLSAGRLELEITESVLLQESERTLATLNELHDFGVRIAMDDFGTGYSSLSYLRNFPFDKVKIDQSFIRDLSHRKNAIHIVRAVINLCAALGMTTTAEGVETQEQLASVWGEGCTEVQGYLFSPPRPAQDVPFLIEQVRVLHQRFAMVAAQDELSTAEAVRGGGWRHDKALIPQCSGARSPV